MDYRKKAEELHRAYYLGAYSPNDDAGNVAAIQQALREAAAEAYEDGASLYKWVDDAGEYSMRLNAKAQALRGKK